MQKVQMTIGGRQALVDPDQVKKHIRKNAAVAKALEIQNKWRSETDPMCKALLSILLDDQMRIIRSIKIRKNVQFL